MAFLGTGNDKRNADSETAAVITCRTHKVRRLSVPVCGPAWPQVMELHHPPKFFRKSVAAKCLFCLYVNITSQCCILNKRDLCDKQFFGGKGSFNDTKAKNITLPFLFSSEKRNSSRQLYVTL